MKSLLSDSLAFFESDLFKTVQLSGLFPDSKTFADAVPVSGYEEVVKSYDEQKIREGFDLGKFVENNFSVPEINELAQSQKTTDIFQHIELLWDVLKKPADTCANSTLIPLNRPYIVPGGRFQEIYYWDSYFTALGLISSGRESLVHDMLDNLVALQASVGVIPNGNRSYYHSRSQPPVLSLFVMLLANHQEDKVKFVEQYIDAITAEYNFWMAGAEHLTEHTDSSMRVVKMPDGTLLNRYWDDQATPRPESFLEDIELANCLSEEQRPDFYRHIRAACESGWDFSSRWLGDDQTLDSIQTTDIVPVDLNCLLYLHEQNLSECFKLLGKHEQQAIYQDKAATRKAAINRFLWCAESEFYFDYNITNKQRSHVHSIVASLPLFAGIATNQQADAVAKHIEQRFLQKGGVVTTLNSTSQQWDAPNGWAPLQWFTVKGLMNYGRDDLARNIATRWNSTVEVIFNRSGKIMEKYNVHQQEDIAIGGEYEVQEGFGWTNGVFLDFHNLLASTAD